MDIHICIYIFQINVFFDIIIETNSNNACTAVDCRARFEESMVREILENADVRSRRLSGGNRAFIGADRRSSETR